MKRIKNFSEFLQDLENDENAKSKIKENPTEGIKLFADAKGISDNEFTHPLMTDKWIYRIVVIALATIILSVVFSSLIVFCSCNNCKEIPSGIIAIGSTAVGALAGMIAIQNKRN